MKVAIIGTRGIPAKYGGFETFAQEISVRLQAMGLDVTVFCPPNSNPIDSYNGVKLQYMDVSKDDAPLRYYFKSVVAAVKSKFDVVLSCGGTGLAYLPYKWRIHRPVFITNTDGIEYLRTKWNIIIRLGVRFVGEMASVMLSDVLVADSKGIKSHLSKEYRWVPRKKIYTIEYGAEVISKDDYPAELIGDYGVTPDEYYLVVSRLEPENNVAMIIDGYCRSGVNKPLIVVGNLKDTPYVKGLQASAEGHDVRFVGGIYDPDKLKAMRLWCKAYLHGHSVGGTNPSLLEALGAGNIVIGHDNPFVREVTDNKMFYFANADECASVFRQVDQLSADERSRYEKLAVARITDYYNWNRIAEEYFAMFNQCYKK